MIFDINYANEDTVKITKILDNGGKIINKLDKNSFIREFIQRLTTENFVIEEKYFPNGMYEYISNQFSFVYVIETHEYKSEFKTNEDLVLVIKMSLDNEFEKATIYKTEGLIFPAFSRFIKILDMDKKQLSIDTSNIDNVISSILEKFNTMECSNINYKLYTYKQIVNI